MTTSTTNLLIVNPKPRALVNGKNKHATQSANAVLDARRCLKSKPDFDFGYLDIKPKMQNVPPPIPPIPSSVQKPRQKIHTGPIHNRQRRAQSLLVTPLPDRAFIERTKRELEALRPQPIKEEPPINPLDKLEPPKFMTCYEENETYF